MMIKQRIVYFGCMKQLLVAAGLLLSLQTFAHSTKVRPKEGGYCPTDTPRQTEQTPAFIRWNQRAPADTTDAGLKNAAAPYIQKYGRHWGKRVYRKELQTDMTKPMVFDILGEPNEYSNIPSPYGVSELWLYKTGNQIKQVIFLNNKVIAVHNLTL